MIRNKDTKFTKLFVGGIPYESDDDALRNFFGQFGEIEEAVVIRDRFTKKSKGYGFVTMATSDAAAMACKNKRPMIDGRQANVNLAYLGAKPKPAKIPGKLSTNPTYSFHQACAVGANQQYVFAPLYSPSQSQSPMSPLSIIPPQSPNNGIAQSMATSFQQPCYVDYGNGAMVVFNTVYDPYYYQPAATYVPSPTGNNNVNQVFTFPPAPTGPPTPPLNGTINGQAFIHTASPFEMVGQPQVQCQ